MTRLRAEDTLLMLVDCQAGPLGMVRTTQTAALADAVASLARVVAVLRMPMILATAPVPGSAGELVPELALVAAGASRIARHRSSVWEKQASSNALAASRRNTVGVAGIGTDVAIALPALAAQEIGLPYEADLPSLDGNTGAVHAGELTLLTERPDQALAAIAAWRRAAAA